LFRGGFNASLLYGHKLLVFFGFIINICVFADILML